MSDSILSPAAIRDLRHVVYTADARAVPVFRLLALREKLPDTVDLSIDFRAADELGFPLVVLRHSGAGHPRFDSLTPREREVASLLSAGLTNRAIAARLFITLGTVKDHVHGILDKTCLPNRAAVAAAWTAHRS